MRSVLLLFLAVMLSASYGQSEGNAFNSNAQQTPLLFDQQEFGDRFSVLVFSDDSYDYYAIDLTRLGGKFERVYFMNLSYEDNRLVNLDADVEKDQTWFKAYYTHPESEINCFFTDLKEKTDQKSKAMTDGEKTAWMISNNKFEKAK